MREHDLTYVASASFTRPNDATQYDAGDLVANSATAGSVTLLSFAFAGSEPVWLRKIKLTKSDPDITNAAFRLWLIDDSAVTFSNGDNGALAIGSSTLPIASVLGYFDITLTASLTGAGDLAFSTFDRGLHKLPSTTYGFLEARGAYTPGAQEAFVVELSGEPY